MYSGPLIEAMTPKCGQECRMIDRITVKGSDVPMDLYTCDVDIEHLENKIKIGEVDKFQKEKMTRNEKKTLKFRNRMKRDLFRKDVVENNIDLHRQFFQQDSEIFTLREPYTKEFKDTFGVGFQQFVDGKWTEAKRTLESVHVIYRYLMVGSAPHWHGRAFSDTHHLDEDAR